MSRACSHARRPAARGHKTATARAAVARAARRRRSRCSRSTRGRAKQPRRWCDRATPCASGRVSRRAAVPPPTCTPLCRARCASIGRGFTVPGGVGDCIVIDGDGRDDREPGLAPFDWRSLDGRDPARAHRRSRDRRARRSGVPDRRQARTGTAAGVGLAAAERRGVRAMDLLRRRADARSAQSDVVLGAQVMLAACGAARCTIARRGRQARGHRCTRGRAGGRTGDARLELVDAAGRVPARRRGHC